MINLVKNRLISWYLVHKFVSCSPCMQEAVICDFDYWPFSAYLWPWGWRWIVRHCVRPGTPVTQWTPVDAAACYEQLWPCQQGCSTIQKENKLTIEYLHVYTKFHFNFVYHPCFIRFSTCTSDYIVWDAMKI